MKDGFNREIDYLRLSVTERCGLKCEYCRALEGACPKAAELSADALVRIARAAAALGIKKIRLTGGEPLIRRDIAEIIGKIAAIDGIHELAMTTNAQQLSGRVKELTDAGLTRLNISLDSLDSETYRDITHGGELSPVLSAIDEALSLNVPLKLNTVLLRGVNDQEAGAFMALTLTRPMDVRFIELMPLGGADMERRVQNDELISAHPELIPLPPRYAGQPSRDYRLAGALGRVGFISPISARFCAECDRIRIMSDGALRPCLGRDSEISLLPALNAGDAELTEAIRRGILSKPACHAFAEDFASEKNMSRIGG